MSSEKGWTPGPWNLGWGNGLHGNRVSPTVYLDDYDEVETIPIRCGSLGIAWILVDDKGNGIGNAIDDANLIASAPDLFDELESLVDWCATNLPDGMFEQMKEKFKSAHRAMAKARGES